MYSCFLSALTGITEGVQRIKGMPLTAERDVFIAAARQRVEKVQAVLSLRGKVEATSTRMAW